MIRQGVVFIALAIAGLWAIAVYNAKMDHPWAPLYSPLSVTTNRYTTPAFLLQPGYNYGIRITTNPGHAVPYADCLLGASETLKGGDCKGHPPALNVSYAIRDDRGGIVASGSAPHDMQEFDYTGDAVDTTIAYFSVHRATKAALEFRVRGNAAPLAPLHPHVAVFAPDAGESASVVEFFIALLLFAVGSIGLVILVSFIASRYLPVRRKSGAA